MTRLGQAPHSFVARHLPQPRATGSAFKLSLRVLGPAQHAEPRLPSLSAVAIGCPTHSPTSGEACACTGPCHLNASLLIIHGAILALQPTVLGTEADLQHQLLRSLGTREFDGSPRLAAGSAQDRASYSLRGSMGRGARCLSWWYS